jgi:hypothetical protein
LAIATTPDRLMIGRSKEDILGFYEKSECPHFLLPFLAAVRVSETLAYVLAAINALEFVPTISSAAPHAGQGILP